MDSFITTFHIDWKIIIAQMINFIIVLLVLQFLALKPLRKLMSERKSRIEGGLKDAKLNAELLQNTQKEYDAILAKARSEAHDLYQEGKKEAENKKTEMLKNAEEEVEKMIQTGKKNLENEKARILEEAKAEIVGLVIASTEKLLKDKAHNSNTEQIKKI